jgi:hypothetical protein
VAAERFAQRHGALAGKEEQDEQGGHQHTRLVRKRGDQGHAERGHGQALRLFPPGYTSA